MTQHYCNDHDIYDLGKGIYANVLNGVWQYIKSSEHSEDLKRILKSELEDNLGMCAQGNLSRLCNILSGYMEEIDIRSLNEIISADLFLDKIFSSDIYATPGSKRDIEELNAATDNSIKNKGPINCPNCIWLKAESIETKTSPGPLFGSKLKAKIIGKIAKPAKIAIRVSSEATVKEVPTTFCSFGIYAP